MESEPLDLRAMERDIAAYGDTDNGYVLRLIAAYREARLTLERQREWLRANRRNTISYATLPALSDALASLDAQVRDE